jgi:tRNA(Met) C34 N-acetyltransferase TmcA
MMALYVSSHYKNSPNDLMLMSDAPAHHLFVLLPRIDETTNTLPEILCVIQVLYPISLFFDTYSLLSRFSFRWC